MGIAAGGDYRDDGFDAFYRREFGRVAGSLVLMGADRGTAEELTQDGFVKALGSWRRVSAMERPGAWVQTVTVNLLRRRYRRNGRLVVGADDVGNRLVDPEPGLDLRRAIAALPFDQRAAVVLRHVLGYTTAETAAMLSRSEAATRALLYRALQELRGDPLLLADPGEELE